MERENIEELKKNNKILRDALMTAWKWINHDSSLETKRLFDVRKIILNALEQTEELK